MCGAPASMSMPDAANSVQWVTTVNGETATTLHTPDLRANHQPTQKSVIKDDVVKEWVVNILSSDGVTLYQVEVTGYNVLDFKMECNCQAGQKNTLCKHIGYVIKNDLDNIPKSQRGKAGEVFSSIVSTKKYKDVTEFYLNIVEYEKAMVKLKKDINATKKRIARVLAS